MSCNLETLQRTWFTWTKNLKCGPSALEAICYQLSVREKICEDIFIGTCCVEETGKIQLIRLLATATEKFLACGIAYIESCSGPILAPFKMKSHIRGHRKSKFMNLS